MNKIYLTCLALNLIVMGRCYAQTEPVPSESSDIFTINSVRAVLFYEDGTDIITKMQTERTGLDGLIHPLDDMMFRSRVRHDAQKYHMEPDEEAVEGHLKAVQQENNLSDDAFQALLKQNGFTLEQAKKEFRDIIAENTVLDYKLRSRLIVPRTLVEEFYREHPVMTEASVILKRAVIPFEAAMPHEEQKKALQAQCDDGQVMAQAVWGEPFSILVAELSAERKFLADLKPGAVCVADELADGFEILMVVEKHESRLLTLDERYNEIVDTLKRPKFDEMMRSYRETLEQSAAVLVFPAE